MNLDDFPICNCFDQYRRTATHTAETHFHADRQDVGCDAWKRLVDLVEKAADAGTTEFSPLNEMSMEDRRRIVTLPPSIARLKFVTRLVLYHTWLVRIPPEIGEMENLEQFEPYWSHRLHWVPYELTRCRKLRSSCVSTRSLYGNHKIRPPFPRLQPRVMSASARDFDDLDPAVFGTDRITACSVCRGPLSGPVVQVWLSARFGTDVWPFLVNACSDACIRQLPGGAEGYVATSHTGGLDLRQPARE